MIGWVCLPMISRVPTYGDRLILCMLKEATGCSLLGLGLMLGWCELPGILCIGSYVYHSDVIAVTI